MVNYAGAFSQSESGKYFEWIITKVKRPFILRRFYATWPRVRNLNYFLCWIIAVSFKRKSCLSRPAVRCAALLIGIALAAVVISSVYAAGLFNSGPELPEVMEGEATFVTDDGEGEVFHIVVDYKRKLIQLTSLGNLPSSSPVSGRRLMSFEENGTTNGTSINATKIVIQDYNTVSFKPCQLTMNVASFQTRIELCHLLNLYFLYKCIHDITNTI